ncbi:MAG: type I-C CRISPR-associated endonuclease Cas1 [Polyangiaceae bacterium]|nr:type I-C CRISPR-associated endonuclease Cas1 [Polyangiaceae bacterium]
MNIQLNTLFITADGAYVHKDHATVVVRVDGEAKLQVPLMHLASVVCFGRVSMSPELMAALSEAGTHIAFFTPSGRFLARVEGVPGGNVLLRRRQYRAADEEATSLGIARSMVIGKVVNARSFLLQARRDAAAERREAIAAACDRLSVHLRGLSTAPDVASVRGFEGVSAKEYFGVFNHLIKREEEELRFMGRSRRPPKDRVNALLSFGYALLLQDCAGAAAGVGLDPAVGFLHEERPGRLSLALDLMEELRVVVVDRLVLSLLNRGQIGVGDFTEEASGGYRLADGARKKLLVAYQEAKQVEVLHSFLDQAVPWGRVPHLQSLLLARTLRGDLEVYPPFSIR